MNVSGSAGSIVLGDRPFNKDGETREDMHIYPADDLRPHDASKGCWCKPTNEYIDVYFGIQEIVTHIALDGRTRYERGAPFE